MFNKNVFLMLNKIIIFAVGLMVGLIAGRSPRQTETPSGYSLTLSVDTIVKIVERPRPIAVRHAPETLTVVRHDTLVEMVREVKTYTDSSNYLAVVSGYDARLDTLRILNTVVTQTERSSVRRRHWGLGVTGGIGCSQRGVAPSVTFGLTYMF